MSIAKTLLKYGAKKYGDRLYLNDSIALSFFNTPLNLDLRQSVWYDTEKHTFIATKMSTRASIEVLGYPCKQHLRN